MSVFCSSDVEHTTEYPAASGLNSGIHLWTTVASKLGSSFKNNQKILSAEELNRAESFFSESLRLNYITAHAFLRNVLSYYIGVEPAEIVFKKDINKKPLIAYPPASVHFNLSHSGDAVAVAVSKYPVGVDIEHIKQNFNFNEIIRSYFSSKERKLITDSPELPIQFFRLWTRKESLLKATGEGISDALSQIEVCDGENSAPFPEDFFVRSFEKNDLCISIASPKKLRVISIL